MAGFYGADTEQLRAFGDLVGTSTGRLSDIAARLAAQVNSVEWVGPDADNFRSDYAGRVHGLFDSATGLMGRFRQEAGGHADEQDQASGPGDADILGPLGDAAWEFLNHPLTSGGLALVDFALSAIESATGAGWARVGGLALAPISIVTGVNQMFNPEHDGWRGVGDRIAGGLSVVSGVAAFIPGGQIVSAVAGGLAAAWNVGNWVYDNWDSITDTVSGAINAVGDAASSVVDFVGDVGGGIADFVGGLF